jgi:hypothetical protein
VLQLYTPHRSGEEKQTACIVCWEFSRRTS